MGKKAIIMILFFFCIASTVVLSVWGSISLVNTHVRVEGIEIIDSSKDDLKCDYNADGEKVIQITRGTKTYQIEYAFTPSDPTDKTVYFEILSGTESATIDENGLITFINETIITVKISSNLDDAKYDVVKVMFIGNQDSNIEDKPFE